MLPSSKGEEFGTRGYELILGLLILFRDIFAEAPRIEFCGIFVFLLIPMDGESRGANESAFLYRCSIRECPIFEE